MASNDTGSNKLWVVEFPEMPGVVFTVKEQLGGSRRESIMLSEFMLKVAADIWFRRSDADKQRVIDETRRMAELTDATLAYVLGILERDTAKQDAPDIPTIAVRGSKP